MVEHCDFQEQVSVNTEDGKLRPDMIIQLPNNHEIVVDSKVPLAAYLAAFDTLDDNERQAKMAEHVNQVRARVRELSDKEYWSQFKKSPDFVVMFLPDETFFSAALQMDPELIEFGVKRRVLLATPTTLIALLKSAAFGWRQDSLAQNAQQISDLGKELYDRIRIFAQHMDGVRGGIEQSVRSYNKAVGSLETRVLASARRFKDLSATTAGDLPESLPVDTTLRVLTAGSGE
jgi:DNA recombination protein RmuC